MAKLVNIGMIQMNVTLGDVQGNLEKAAQFVEDAAEKGSQIICLPKLFSTGYHLNYLGEKTVELGLTYFQDSVQFLSNVARKNKVYLIAPIPEEREIKGVLYNSALLFNDEGDLEGSYAAPHLQGEEAIYFREGNEFPVFETKYGKIGIAMFYDVGFPEVSRILSLKGAEMIFIPGAWKAQNMDMWDLILPQRALENLVYTIGVNHISDDHGLELFGKSKI
ncbi:nitrilase-related carbon-nitrogen hydrolase [Oceanobacillus luteolus]|uniref:Nitrilase-related carbon-nitrogen hydrolase n=2 Tax=Oceanobacillus luteolus TaxID=1274358 RepID=A0ABW4HYH5_9BACI